VLVGSDTTFNPKMNNVRKGLEAARRPVVALCDAGIVLDADTLAAPPRALSDTVGLVLALKAAEAPEFRGRARARLHQRPPGALPAGRRPARHRGRVRRRHPDDARHAAAHRQLARLQPLDRRRLFGHRSVRELGLQTRLGDVMPRLPLGRRDGAVVWSRQVRWARTRLRLPVWPLVLWEPAIGWAHRRRRTGRPGGRGVGAGWSRSGRAYRGWLRPRRWFWPGAAAVRRRARRQRPGAEALAPLLMLRALSGRRIDWRGTDLGGQWRGTQRGMARGDIR
jgi:ceramide glucosyltransferase